MTKQLLIVLAGAALMFGATTSLMSSAALAHHTTQHSIAHCGHIVCNGAQKKDASANGRGR